MKSPRFTIPSGTFDGFRRGYYSNSNKAPDNTITSPSLNVIIDNNGRAAQRLGYQAENLINLGGASNPATCFYLEQYDVTVFAKGTSVKYYDWTKQAVYDTGLTLTTGTVTRFDAYAGDVYLTNTTDGMRRIMFSKVTAAVSAGAATITIESGGTGRMSAFGNTTGNIRIKGTNEAFSSITVATGVITLTGTASQAYAVNDLAIFVQDISGSIEKFSKIFFWKERMGGIGSTSGTNADQPNATEFFGKFAGATNLEDIINFTYGAGGSTREIVGKWGKVTNAVPVKDFLYTFKESQTYLCAASSVSLSGSTIGQTTPDLRDEVHGCVNEDSACAVGNNEITYITNDKRIMRIKISTESGAAVVFPDETFDVFIQDDLKNMDADQTGARAFYHKGKKRSIYQIRISGQWYWYIYDHSLPVYNPSSLGGSTSYGAWFAPHQVFFAQDFFERKGVLYATDGTTDTVYSIGTSFDDNGSPILSAVYTGNFNVGSAEMQEASLQGEISQAAIVKLQSFVTNTNGGRQNGSQKSINGAGFSYSSIHGVGADGIGAGGVESDTTLTAEWAVTFQIYPSESNRIQLGITNENGGYYSISSYSLAGKRYPMRSSAL